MNNQNNGYLATKWYPDTLIGIFAIIIYVISNIIFYTVMYRILVTTDTLIFGSIIFSIVVMLGLFVVQQRKLYPDMSFNGTFSRSDYQICLVILLVLMALFTLFSAMFNLSEETFLRDLFENNGQLDTIFICISAVILSPILEEILFRHFILAMIPYNLGGKWAAYAIIFSSLLFALSHIQYEHTFSLIFIFIIGIILALARIISQGLLLPILLHCSYNLISLILYFLM